MPPGPGPVALPAKHGQRGCPARALAAILDGMLR